MSYDLMVFNHLKVPYELEMLRKWFNTHMEDDTLPNTTPIIFATFLESIKKVFPSINHCSEEQLDYACDYEVHEDFIYMSFGYSVAKNAHDIVKRQARIDNLGFWEISKSFDSAFPITCPTDKWPMIIEAAWIKGGKHFVYNFSEIRNVLIQMKTARQSSVCLTNRYGDYIQAGGYGDTFIVETRKYVDAVTYKHMRADLKSEVLDADTSVSINNFNIIVPETQIFSKNQVCLIFQEFINEIELEDLVVFWKKIDI